MVMSTLSDPANRARLQRLRETLQEMWDVSGQVNSGSSNSTIADALISNELKRFVDRQRQQNTETEILIDVLCDAELRDVENRCLFYACEELTRYLAKRKIKTNAIMLEEAVLYVQDRLFKDNFRRIKHYQADREVKFKTYIWQVINNLLIDFIRRHNSQKAKEGFTELTDIETLGDSGTANLETPEVQFDQDRIHDAIQSILIDKDESQGISASALHQKIRPYLQLSHYERLFLRSMFVHDLSIAEVRRLPMFNMAQNEAYRFYYDLMQKLLEVFKQADVVDELTLAISGQSLVQVIVNDSQLSFAMEKIVCLQHYSSEQTKCHIAQGSQVITGYIEERLSAVKKQLKSGFSEVDGDTLVADPLLRRLVSEWVVLK